MHRLIVNLGSGGDVAVFLQRGGELPEQIGETVALSWPLDGDALDELRWYLEDYLRAPYGAFADRGERVADRLPEWGHAIFEALFGTGRVRDALVAARATGRVEIVFRSAVPEWLGLPWELLTDPDRPGPLVLDGVCVDRSLPAAQLAQVFDVPGGRLRVLMVIARPAGVEDVGFQMIARPLLRRLEAVRGHVDLVVLRPPTLDRLREVLAQAAAEGQPFQVVHFDGHGVLTGARAGGVLGPLTYAGGGEGVLVFERPGGGADHVPAGTIAQVLAEAKVPVVVLNACQSAAIGKQVEAAVATRLLQGGASSVVAMAYSVYAVAAAEFMTAFYERLFAGDSVSRAVTAGRAQLARKKERPSPKGLLPLADWLVPVHYLRAEARFPGLTVARPVEVATLEESLDRLLSADADAAPDDALAPVGAFVGRDGLFYVLESAARAAEPILLHGPGGTGKTELAKAFGRWCQDTDGVARPDWVIWHSLEPGVATFGVEGLIARVGAVAFGTPFFGLRDQAQRRAVVVDALRKARMLLVLDNFESVASMPDPGRATPPLEEAEQAELLAFLTAAAAGASTVLITSRTPEAWLGVGIRRIEVPGLTEAEAVDYAEHLLAPFPDSRARRADPAFLELMSWLDGHPLSMRLILPRLDTTDPQPLLAELRGLTAPAADLAGGRTTSLTASVAYSFSHLHPATADALTVLSLFHGVADADVLGWFSAVAGVPAQFAGLDRQGWTEALEEAVRVGLLTDLGDHMYGIQPALPAYLAARWRAEAGELFDQQHEATAQALADVYAGFGNGLSQQMASGDAEFVLAIIGRQHHTIGAMLTRQLRTGRWAAAQALLQPLNDYWLTMALLEEADRWTDRVYHAVEGPDGSPPALDTAAGSLWVFVSAESARRLIMAGRLDAAETINRTIISLLPEEGEQAATRRSRAYHQLGIIAELQGDLDGAEGWYRQALAIVEELGDRPAVGGSFHQIGSVAQRRGDLEQAEDLFRRSLAIWEEIGDQARMADSYHQLGVLAEDQGDLEQAEDWHRRSLTIREQLGDRLGVADSYHQLGMVAQRHGALDMAEDLFRRSLAVREQLGDRPGVGRSYHHLGMIAQARGDLDQAEDWYRRSFAIKEMLNDRPGMANAFHQLGVVAYLREDFDEAEARLRRSLEMKEQLQDRPGRAISYGQLGLLAERRQDVRQALVWTIRSVALFEGFPHPSTGPAPWHLYRLSQKLGITDTERIWQETTGHPMPATIRVILTSELSTEPNL